MVSMPNDRGVTSIKTLEKSKALPLKLLVAYLTKKLKR
jgi:hypothetical protein